MIGKSGQGTTLSRQHGSQQQKFDNVMYFGTHDWQVSRLTGQGREPESGPESGPGSEPESKPESQNEPESEPE